MSEMVEMVASTLYDWNVEPGMMPSWKELSEEQKKKTGARSKARATIKAMMEPTEVMLARANHLNHPRDIEVWQTMLIAALEESKE